MRGPHFRCTVAAAVAMLVPAGHALPSSALPQARAPIGIAWLILVDDLHIDFRNTGYLRNLLKTIASDLIRDGDVFAVRFSGPSASIDLTSDKRLFEDVIPKTSGNGMKADDIQAATRMGSGEVEYRVKVAVAAAMALIESFRTANRGKALVYISNGYVTDVSARLSELTGAALQANVTMFAIDPRGVPGSPLAGERSPVTQASLRAIVEPTRGFALLGEKDFAEGIQRIRRAMGGVRR